MANRCVNKVILIGNLTRDPELRYTPEGVAVCTFGVATNRGWMTSDGQKKEEVQYHRIVAWQKLAELCAKILTKGKKVYLEGRLTYRTFTSKDNQERSITEIVLDDFVSFEGKKRESDGETEVEKEEKNSFAEEGKNDELKQEENYQSSADLENKEEAGETNKELNEVQDDNGIPVEENVNPEDIPF